MPPVPRPAFARLCLAAILASVVLPAWAAKVADVQVKGLDPAMTENVRRSLSLVDSIGKDVSGRRLAYLVREAEAETREALEPFGYYSPVIDVQRTRGATDAPVTVTITVQPGTPVRVRNSDVGICGTGSPRAASAAAVSTSARHSAATTSVSSRSTHTSATRISTVG